jgi:hypothetical protein
MLSIKASQWQDKEGDSMKKTIKKPIVICLLVNIFILLFDYFKIDLLYLADNYSRNAFEEITLKSIAFVPFALYVIFVVGLLIYIGMNIKVLKWKAALIIAIFSLTVLFYLFVPYSNTFAKLQYNVNKDHYAKTIKLLHSGELPNYHAEEDTYIVPYRFTSYTRLMNVQNSGGVTKIWFDVYKGLTKIKIIVYTSDDSGIKVTDFSKGDGYTYTYSDIKKIETNWYSATVNY